MTKRDIMRRNTPAVTFRDLELETWLTEQAEDGESVGLTAKRLLWTLRQMGDMGPDPARDLGRYRELLARELRRVPLSREEAMLLLDVSNGTLWQPFYIPLLWAEVEEGLKDGLGEKWGVDGPALVEKLRGLSLGGLFTVVDALERAWRIGDDLDAAAQAVGLIRRQGQ